MASVNQTLILQTDKGAKNYMGLNSPAYLICRWSSKSKTTCDFQRNWNNSESGLSMINVLVLNFKQRLGMMNPTVHDIGRTMSMANDAVA